MTIQNVSPITINSQNIHGIEVYNIVEVYQALGLEWNDWANFQTWAQANNLDYYGRVREHFSEYEAAGAAWRLGYYGVVVEDLS